MITLCRITQSRPIEKLQVTGCLYKQTHLPESILRAFVSLRLFLGGGGSKSILFYLFRNEKASCKASNTSNGLHM